MQLKLINQEQWGDYFLEIDTLHLVNFKKGVFSFPKVNRLCRVQLLFTEHGEYAFDAVSEEFQLGSTKARYCSIQTGVPGFDMMPDFIFNPQKGIWHINTRGNFIFYGKDECDLEKFR